MRANRPKKLLCPAQDALTQRNAMDNFYILKNLTAIQRKRLKQLALITVVFVIFISVFLWFYGHSFIKVSVDMPVNGEIHYELINQNTKKSSTYTTKASSIKKLVKKGSYEMLVKNQETSSFSVQSTKSFLRTTTINSNLQTEKSREFVGNNPGPCMYYDQSVLISYPCDGSYGDASEENRRMYVWRGKRRY